MMRLPRFDQRNFFSPDLVDKVTVTSRLSHFDPFSQTECVGQMLTPREGGTSIPLSEMLFPNIFSVQVLMPAMNSSVARTQNEL